MNIILECTIFIKIIKFIVVSDIYNNLYFFTLGIFIEFMGAFFW